MKTSPSSALANGKVCYVGDRSGRGHCRELYRRPRTPRKRSWSTTAFCRRWSIQRPQQNPARRKFTTSRRTTPCSTGISATKRRPTPRFKSAAHVTKIDLINNRVVPAAIEPRAAVGEYDSGSESFTLYTTSQNPHAARLVLAAFCGIAPENKLRVIAPDVGGGFGSKIFIYAEETVCVWAAKKVGRPVKWTAERSESFLVDAHGRDHVTHAELALDQRRQDHRSARPYDRQHGRISSRCSGRRSRLIFMLRCCRANTPSRKSIVEVDAVYTNTAPVDAVRGAGRPEATFVVERIVELAARETGRDPVAVPPRQFRQVVPASDAGVVLL